MYVKYPPIKSPIPIYCIDNLDSRYVIIAGGGGSSNTGISNILNIYRIHYDKGYFGELFYTLDMKKDAPMNMSIKSIQDKYFLAIGADNKCNTFNLNINPILPEKFSIEKLKSTLIDEGNYETYQKSVCISPQNRSLVSIISAASDGYVRIMNSNLKMLHNFSVFESEIDDMDICDQLRHIALISRNSPAQVWSFDGKQECTLEWNYKSGYKFRACKYRNNYELLTVHNPSNKKETSYLSLWEISTNDYKFCKAVPIAKENCSKLASNAHFIVVGTNEGSVFIFNASLQALCNIKAHTAFITGLNLLNIPNYNDYNINHYEKNSDSILNYSALLFTTSIDNRINIVKISSDTNHKFTIKIVLIYITIAVISILISFVNKL